jgi:hypothetical protein
MCMFTVTIVRFQLPATCLTYCDIIVCSYQEIWVSVFLIPSIPLCYDDYFANMTVKHNKFVVFDGHIGKVVNVFCLLYVD